MVVDNFQEQAASSFPLCDCESTRGAPASPTRLWQEIGLVLALWLLHCAGNWWWLWVDTRPPYSDAAGHITTTLRISILPWRQMLMEGRISELLTEFYHYPPFLYLTAAPLTKLFVPTADVLMTVQSLFMGLLIFSTYGIGRLAVGRNAGLLAAFLVSMYPLLYGLSRIFLIDVPLTAMTAFAVFCLFWSESFQRRWPSLVVGVAFGLGMLTKWTFAVFILGPLLVAVYISLRHATRARLINLVLAGLLSLAISLPYYVNNWQALQALLQLIREAYVPLENEPAVASWASWLYYLRALIDEQILLPFALLALLGTLLALRRCRLNSYLWMLLAWIVIGYISGSLFENKDTRYTLPYLPALALLTAIGLVQIRQVMVQRVGLALIVLYALVQYAGLTVGLSDKLVGVPAQISGRLGQMPFRLYAESVHAASAARSENWQVEPIVQALSTDLEERAEPRRTFFFLVVPNSVYFDAQAFDYIKWRDRLPLEIRIVTGIVDIDSAPILEESDYVVIKSGDQGQAHTVQDAGKITAQLLDTNSPLRSEFDLLAEFPLPDHSTAYLFRHVHQ